MRNIKITVEYEGTNYNGFQIQEGTNLPTIQGVLEEKIALVSKEKVRIAGAGRTDSGVHAKGQVISFRSDWKIPIDKIPFALNSVLPKDIIISEAIEVPESFHARFSAQGKRYRYRIYNNRIPSAFEVSYSWFIPYCLDTEAMQEAAKLLIGQHDFSSFKSSGTVVQDNLRTIYSLDLARNGNLLTLDVYGNGFLYNMVRIITGTLVEVGRGKLRQEGIKEILVAKDRRLAGPTAPPQGLFLMEVLY